MKLPQNDDHQMLQCILSGFWDSIFYQRVIALVLNSHFELLCATPPTVLMRFELNFHRMIVSKCSSAYCQCVCVCVCEHV